MCFIVDIAASWWEASRFGVCLDTEREVWVMEAIRGGGREESNFDDKG